MHHHSRWVIHSIAIYVITRLNTWLTVENMPPFSSPPLCPFLFLFYLASTEWFFHFTSSENRSNETFLWLCGWRDKGKEPWQCISVDVLQLYKIYPVGKNTRPETYYVVSCTYKGNSLTFLGNTRIYFFAKMRDDSLEKSKYSWGCKGPLRGNLTVLLLLPHCIILIRDYLYVTIHWFFKTYFCRRHIHSQRVSAAHPGEKKQKIVKLIVEKHWVAVGSSKANTNTSFTFYFIHFFLQNTKDKTCYSFYLSSTNPWKDTNQQCVSPCLNTFLYSVCGSEAQAHLFLLNM